MKDLIERQAAIDALGGNEPVGDPSKMDDDDVVKMWEQIRIINIINKLSSVQPEQKTGKWILKEHLYECDKCGCRISRFPFKGNIWNYYFCPNCGAKMEEGGQDEQA